MLCLKLGNHTSQLVDHHSPTPVFQYIDLGLFWVDFPKVDSIGIFGCVLSPSPGDVRRWFLCETKMSRDRILLVAYNQAKMLTGQLFPLMLTLETMIIRCWHFREYLVLRATVYCIFFFFFFFFINERVIDSGCICQAPYETTPNQLCKDMMQPLAI